MLSAKADRPFGSSEILPIRAAREIADSTRRSESEFFSPLLIISASVRHTLDESVLNPGLPARRKATGCVQNEPRRYNALVITQIHWCPACQLDDCSFPGSASPTCGRWRRTCRPSSRRAFSRG